jgi:prevent-host-death family protein
MRTASVSELKAHLSRFLREVRRGDEVQVLDRGRPVARLVGLTHPGGGSDGGADHRAALVRDGVLRPGTRSVAQFLQQEPLHLDTDLRRAVDDDRADRV